MQLTGLFCAGAVVLVGVAVGQDSAAVEPVVPADAIEGDDECAADSLGGTCDVTLAQLRARQTQGVQKFAMSKSLDASAQPKGAAGYSAHSYHGNDGSDGAANIMTLYHQTSKEAGESILKTGFRMSKPYAICGRAIYFSGSAADTDLKAMGGRGYMVEARVNMGHIKQMPATCDKSMSYGKLKAMGYDSITLDRGGAYECKYTASCREYIIYSNKQIISMRGYVHHGVKPWWKHLMQENATVSSSADAVANARADGAAGADHLGDLHMPQGQGAAEGSEADADAGEAQDEPPKALGAE